MANGNASEHASGAVVGFVVAMIIASLLATLVTGILSFRHHTTEASRPSDESEAADLDAGELWKRVDKNRRIAQRYLDEHKRPSPR